MIFSIWFFTWVFVLAGTALHLALPAACLAVRSSYLSRRFFPGAAALVIALFVFLLVRISMPDEALLFGLRALLSLAMLSHLISALRGSRLWLKGIQFDFANGIHLVNRSFRVAKVRIDDLRYTRDIRIRREKVGLNRVIAWFKYNVGYWQASIIEIMQLANTFDDMIRSRGKFPHPTDWQDPRKLQGWLYTADVLLVITVMIGFLGLDGAFLPEPLLGYVLNFESAVKGL